eukprot:5402804-Alexandrium_andersonii.AAC.1
MGGGSAGSSRQRGSRSLPRTAAWKGPRLASTVGPASAATRAPASRLQQVGIWRGRRCAGSSGRTTFGIQINTSTERPRTSS